MAGEPDNVGAAVRAQGAAVKRIVSWLLLLFVVVSIGVALGKEFARRDGAAAGSGGSAAGPVAASRDRVVVYYMHQFFRCVTCKHIEELAWRVVHEEFGDAVADGRLEWRVVNVDADPRVARRYDLVASSVVVSKVRDGREVRWEKLDRVWQLVGNPRAFRTYVAESIKSMMERD